MPKRRADLEIDEDPGFEKAQLRFQRAGFALLVAFLVAALLGLLGPGPLAAGRAGDDALRADYQRFVRHLEPYSLRVEVQPDGRREARVWLSRDYLDRVYVQEVTPEPTAVEADGDRAVYTFARTSATRPLVVTWDFRAHRVGAPLVELGLDGGPSLAFRQILYP